MGETTATAPATSSDMSDNIEAAVRARSAWWTAELNAGRVESLREIYEPNAVLMLAGIPWAKGFDAIRVVVGFLVGSGMRDFMLEIERCEGSGDIAYLYGRYALKVPVPDRIEDRLDYGKFLQVWRKGSDGQWRMAADSASPDTPAPQ